MTYNRPDGKRGISGGHSSSGTGSTGYGSSGTGHTGYGATGTTTAGPHSSNLANEADPRVDSDRGRLMQMNLLRILRY